MTKIQKVLFVGIFPGLNFFSMKFPVFKRRGLRQRSLRSPQKSSKLAVLYFVEKLSIDTLDWKLILKFGYCSLNDILENNFPEVGWTRSLHSIFHSIFHFHWRKWMMGRISSIPPKLNRITKCKKWIYRYQVRFVLHVCWILACLMLFWLGLARRSFL